MYFLPFAQNIASDCIFSNREKSSLLRISLILKKPVNKNVTQEEQSGVQGLAQEKTFFFVCYCKN